LKELQRTEKSKPTADGKKRLAELQAELNTLKKSAAPPPPMAHVIAEGTPTDMKVFLRGNPATLGELSPRRFLHALAGDEPAKFTKGSGRLELAQAVASADNPLTARVFVNRIWA